VRLWSPSNRRPMAAPVRPRATAFALTPAGNGVYRVMLRIPGARTAEISGDFNQWTPVSLRETSDGVWEASVPIAPGTHRVNVRINGDRWTAPPGLPAVNDEFAGRVGIIIVP
jgi:1,4-alpha-glucan branching enzyme